MSKDEKMFYTVDEAMEYLHLTSAALMRKVILYNVEIRKLPGSTKEYIATRDVQILEQSIKKPGSVV